MGAGRAAAGVRAGGDGGEFCATADDAGTGEADFSAMIKGVADTDGFGVGLPFASLPFGVGVAFAPLPFETWTIGGGVTAFAGSTRTS